MSFYNDYNDKNYLSDVSVNENIEELGHRKRIRKLLEDRLERKRLRNEFDELDGEFDWRDYDK
jgi:hypothetical protein